MNEHLSTTAIRRANPIFMLVAGILIGALLVAIGRQPSATDVASGPARGGSQSGPTASSIADPSQEPGTIAAEAGTPTTSGAGSDGPSGDGGVGPANPDSSADPSAATGACASMQQPGVQGVTDTTVKIGFALPDLGPFKVVIDVGDLEAYTRAILAALEDEGRLPICGRNVEPYFRTYNVLVPSESRAACVGFAEEDKVFGVMALYAFAAVDCVSSEKGMYMFDSGLTLTEPSYARSPLLFAASPPVERQLRAYSAWVIEHNISPGKKTGVYYMRNGPGGAAPPGEAVEKNLIDELDRLGHPVDVVVATDGCGAAFCADPNDDLALQRFQTEGVEVVYVMNYKATLIRKAEARGYRPRWVLLGTSMAADVTTGDVPAENFDGSRGLIFEHVGEEKTGIPLSPGEEQCFSRWESQGNTRPESRDSAPAQNIRQVCDQVEVLSRALRGAGGNLTPQTMITGMETIRDAPMAYHSNLTFLPDKHWGGSSNLEVEWHKECTCWKTTGPFRPLFGR